MAISDFKTAWAIGEVSDFGFKISDLIFERLPIVDFLIGNAIIDERQGLGEWGRIFPISLFVDAQS